MTDNFKDTPFKSSKKININQIGSQLINIEKKQNDIFINVKYPPNGLTSVKGDGVTDDSGAIQSILNYIRDNGGGRIYFPNGNYLLGTRLTIYSHTTFYGESQNTVFLANDSLYYLMTIFDNQSTTLDNFTVNGRASERDALGILTKAVYGLSMSRAQNCVIRNIKFINFGYKAQTYSDQDLSLGGNILDMATEDDKLNLRDTSKNIIEKCSFIDVDGRSSFGIRMWSSWTIEPQDRKYYIKDNIIRDNYFKGFNWNSIEMAGAGCINNRIDGNVGEDHFGYSVFEADKGASYNVFTNNIVRNLIATGALSKYGYRDARGSTTTGGHTYYATGNVWSNNLVENVTQGTDTTSGGMLLYGARNSIINNLTVRNIQRSATNTTIDNVGGIVMDDADNCSISSSNISDCRVGIYIMAARNSEVSDSDIGKCAFGVKTSTASFDNSFKGNKIHDITSTGINLTASNTGTNIVDNTIYGCNKAIVTNTSNARINGNTIYNIVDTANGIDCRGGTSVIINNTLRGCRLYLDATGVNNVVFGNNSDLASDSYCKKISYSTTYPSTGTWNKGDTVYNNSPTANGYIGWTCITAGTPGTWKPFGNIVDTKTGTLTYNGDGAATTKVIPHGLAVAPTFFQVTPSSADAGAAGIKFVSADATNLTVTFNTAPIAGTNNVKLTWKAEV